MEAQGEAELLVDLWSGAPKQLFNSLVHRGGGGIGENLSGYIPHLNVFFNFNVEVVKQEGSNFRRWIVPTDDSPSVSYRLAVLVLFS